MYAVIKTGGKQYRVQKDSVIVVELLKGNVGDAVTFDEVLMAGDKVGNPCVKGASVKGTITKQTRGEKVIVFKKKRRQGYRRKNGHKQPLTVVQIDEIKA